LRQKNESEIVQCNHAPDNNTQKDLINYLHAACFSPVKSTWIISIKNGFFPSWPGLNEHTAEKYLSKSTFNAKGHLNQQRQNSRTTKIKDAQLLDPKNDKDHGIKTQFVSFSEGNSINPGDSPHLFRKKNISTNKKLIGPQVLIQN
jgi:hypothetical protein